MQLINSFLCLILASSLRLTSAASLHAHLKGLKGLPQTHTDDAPSTVSHASDTLVHPPRGPERHDGIIKSVSHKDDNSASTLSRFLTSSLDHWGSPVSGGVPHKVEHLLDGQQTQKRSTFGRSALFIVVAALLITIVSCMCACFGRWWDEDETKGPDPTLLAVEHCQGPWAVAYRESQGQKREAIELLFRCNIITMPEFAGHGVSRQHSDISACVQIAVQMLEDRPISDWEAHWQEAHKTFSEAADSRQSSPRGEFSFSSVPASSAPSNRERYLRA